LLRILIGKNSSIIVFIYFTGALIGFYVIEENNKVPAVLDVKSLLIDEISADEISENLKYYITTFGF
jgi:hypothetical protein